jgi:hypothetical protein
MAAGTPTYALNGGERRVDTGTVLASAGSACTLDE